MDMVKKPSKGAAIRVINFYQGSRQEKSKASVGLVSNFFDPREFLNTEENENSEDQSRIRNLNSHKTLKQVKDRNISVSSYDRMGRKPDNSFHLLSFQRDDTMNKSEIRTERRNNLEVLEFDPAQNINYPTS